MSPDSSRQLLQQFFSALDRGDIEAVLACVADGIVHDVNQGGERRIGQSRYHAYLARMMHHYRETITGLVVFISEDGRRAAAEYNLEGTYLQTEDGLPPAAGQTYALPAGAFFAIDEGKITRITQYYNLTDWITQITAGT